MKKFKNFMFLFFVFALMFSAVLFPAKMPVSVHATTPITNLTNTEWIFKETVDVSQNATYFVDFISGYGTEYSTTWTSGTAGAGNPTGRAYIEVYGENIYYCNNEVLYGENEGWESNWGADEDRHIFITGGDDVENPNLINWLYANAELQGGEAEQTGVVANIVLPSILAVTLIGVISMYVLGLKKSKHI